MLVVDVDDDVLVGLLAAAILAVAEQHARAADGKLEAFAAHGLDEDAELELAAARDLERVIVVRGGDADGDVGFRLALQPVADDAALHLVAVLAGIRAVVDREAHGERRRVDRARGHGLGHRGAADGIGDGGLGEARDGDDVARFRAVHGHALQPAEGEHLGRAAGFHLGAGDVQRFDGHVDVQPPALNPARQDASQERVAVKQGGEHLELAVGGQAGLGHVVDDLLEQGRQVARAHVVCLARVAVAPRRVEHGEVELLVIGLERQEQLEHLVEHFGGPRVRAVDLVDDHDGLEAERQRLAGDELGLRHRPFGRVHQQDHAVHHAEDALDLRPEIGVPGRIDDVDVRAVPLDARALGQDGNPALLLKVVRVHRPLLDTLIVTEGAGLAEKLVDEGGLTMIDVRDYGHVA